jgi:fused signal recognition particle receptor
LRAFIRGIGGERLMFDFLKKKISGFIDGITKKEEQKADSLPQEAPPLPEQEEPKSGEPAPAEPEEAMPEPAMQESPEPAKQKVAPERRTEPHGREPAKIPKPKEQKKAPPQERVVETNGIPKTKPAKPEAAPVKKTTPEPKQEAPAQAPKHETPKPETAKPAPAPVIQRSAPVPEHRARPAQKQEAPKPLPAPKKEAVKPEAEPQAPKHETSWPAPPAPADDAGKPKERMKLGIVGTVRSIITREVEISEKDVRDVVDALELELLEADVDIGVSEIIKEEIMAKLVGSKVARPGLHAFVSGSIRETLIGILTNEKDFDIVSRVEHGEKPLKIMFIGINGAGKTTTIAKVAKLLMDNGRKVVFAAADTFRAAAIEQMAVHAERLNVKMIKREYGSDPTSVAYDAVNYARAHGMDAVLIDTAGRQDTNASLLNEMKKMRRVINPDICVYIGESIAGNAIIEQISAFNREVGVDAVILSKLDCDPKGGTMLSISKATGVPIIYVGTGQRYDDLERFDPRAIVARIVE